MLNPFIVIRFIFLGLLTFFNLLVLIIASWHVKTVAAAGLPVPAAAVFLIVLALVSFLFLAAATAPLIVPTASTAKVKFECWWTFLLSIMQTGSTIALTVDGPTIMCRATSKWSVCASSSILVPATWIASLTMLAYFLTLIVTSIAHLSSNPAIWAVGVFTVPWFSQEPSMVPLAFINDKASLKRSRHQTIDAYDEEDNIFFRPSWVPPKRKVVVDGEAAIPKTHRPRSDPDLAPWAREANKRSQRGKDSPFVGPKSPVRTITSKRNIFSFPPIIPALPIQSARPSSERSGSSRCVEVVRESQHVSRRSGGHPYIMTSPDRSMFPDLVDDDNKPIPLPRLSDWIRVDIARGINMHTIPVISPIDAKHHL